ncbi:unnamed protein product [Rhodiola kirilowii]
MKQLLFAHFLPPVYEQILYQRYHNCRQGSKSMQEYSKVFHRLSSRVLLHETEEQVVAHYLNGLRLTIQDRILQTIWKLDEAIQMALKIEAQIARSTTTRFVPKNMSWSQTRFTEPSTSSNHPLDDTRDIQGHEAPRSNQNSSKTSSPSHNPYARTYGGKCNRCGKQCHLSNSCPIRKMVNMVEHSEEAENEIQEVFTGPDDVVAGEHFQDDGAHFAGVIQCLIYHDMLHFSRVSRLAVLPEDISSVVTAVTHHVATEVTTLKYYSTLIEGS